MAGDWPVAKRDEWDIMFESAMTSLIFIVMLAVAVPMLPVVQSAQRYFTSQSYQGDVETRILNAAGTVQYYDFLNQLPCVPLISVFLINRGANRVYIAINEAKDWLEIWPGETRTVSHVGADRRIEILFYKCDPGRTTSVEMEGHF